MKKYFLFLFILACGTVSAQVPEDALRYSFYPQNGTARNLAIGGAMGSLGGDLNAVFVNPAGLGFYKTSELVLSPGFIFNNNKSAFRGTDSKYNKSGFNLGTTGVVLGFSESQDAKSSNALSFAITQTANFNNRIHYKGYNNYSSFSEQFAEEFAKSGYSIDEVLSNNSAFPYTSAPALYTYLIDTVTVNGTRIIKGAPEYILDAGQALLQEMSKKTSGGIYEPAFAFAHNSNDKWYIGGTIGIPIINYRSTTVFTERDTSSNTSNHFNYAEYTDDFLTTGYGFNVKLGLIYRPVAYFRVGLSVHTPSWMSLTDKHTAGLNTEVENPLDSFGVRSEFFTNGQAGKAKYAQNSPWKFLLSASYVFREVQDVTKQRGFITADVEYINHRGSRFKEDGDAENVNPGDVAYYDQLNKVIKQEYKGAFNFRVGGEIKFNTIMGRLGFAYYSNPYKDKELKANRMLLSGGLGYRNKGFFIDLTYVHAISKDVNFPYRLEDRANTFASVKDQRGNVMATVGFKF